MKISYNFRLFFIYSLYIHCKKMFYKLKLERVIPIINKPEFCIPCVCVMITKFLVLVFQ